MKNIYRKVLGLVPVMALTLSVGVASAAEKTKVGFVYVGPIGDHGWSYEHNQGRLAVEKAFGDKVETTYVENVSEGPDAERVIQQLARGQRRFDLNCPVEVFGLIDRSADGFGFNQVGPAQDPQSIAAIDPGHGRVDRLASRTDVGSDGDVSQGRHAMLSFRGRLQMIETSRIPSAMRGNKRGPTGSMTFRPSKL